MAVLKSPRNKGNRTERALCRLLTGRFGREFTRSVGSGNRWGQVASLTRAAKEVFSGDICPPEGFRWVVECKGGYPADIDAAIGGRSGTLDAFIARVEADALRSGRLPLVAWKRDRRPWAALLRIRDLGVLRARMHSMLIYGEWVLVGLEELLAYTDDAMWFEGAVCEN